MSISNEILNTIYPNTFHTLSGRANGVGDAWGVGDSWICECCDCLLIRKNLWERIDNPGNTPSN